MRDPDCLFARMSGSGAAAFGIFVTLDAAERAAARIREARPSWFVTAAMTRAS
jgi:4-diphosphocytidyl-2-C-methyl-D-erythritol kinase